MTLPLSITDGATICLKCPECGKEICKDVIWIKESANEIHPDALLAYAQVGFKDEFTYKHHVITHAQSQVEELMIKHWEDEHI